MIKYSALGRKMNREFRVSYKHAGIAGFSLILVMFYILSGRDSCEVIEEIVTVGKSSDSPIIYAITPTYARPEQIADLTRTSHLFRLNSNLFWVIVEDADDTSVLVRNLINRAGLSNRSVLLHAKTPHDFKLASKDPHWSKPRGVEQRNTALSWIRKKIKHEPGHAIVYFMDDDNSYSVELFEEMSKIKRGNVGVWPVGLVGAMYVEKPLVKDGKVVGFNSAWRPERPFPIDMAAFAISCDLLENNPDAMFTYNAQNGYQESEILKHVTTREKLQPVAYNRVLVWHTRTEKTKLVNEQKLAANGLPPSDANMIV